jgi:hypothetical protein
VKLTDLQIMFLWIPSFVAYGKCYAMGKDGKHGLHKVCGFPHEGRILEMHAFSSQET